MVGPSKEIQRSLLSLGSSQPQRRSLLSMMFSRGGMESRWQRPPRADISFQRVEDDLRDSSKHSRAGGPDAKRLAGECQAWAHVPGWLCWRIREVARSKETDQLTAARARRCPGKLLQFRGVALGPH